jgi:GxxExxY protein
MFFKHRAHQAHQDSVIVAIKATETLSPIHQAQILTYQKLSGCRVGLLINFNSKLIKDGIKRYVF